MAKRTYKVVGTLSLVLDRVKHEPGTEFTYEFEPEHEEHYLSTGQLEVVEKPKKGES